MAADYMKHFHKVASGWVCRECGTHVLWPSTHALFHEWMHRREARRHGK